jgi:hypothetical protein
MNTSFLTKLFSKQVLAYATQMIQAQSTAATPEDAAANHKKVVDGVLSYLETLDNSVVLIPFIGPFLAALIDTPMVDGLERQLVEALVELAYRPLKYSGAL